MSRKGERCPFGQPDSEHIVIGDNAHGCGQPDLTMEHLAALHGRPDLKHARHEMPP
jgi:hypothetical protein